MMHTPRFMLAHFGAFAPQSAHFSFPGICHNSVNKVSRKQFVNVEESETEDIAGLKLSKLSSTSCKWCIVR